MPVYNLMRHGHILDPAEALVISYNDQKTATFMSSSATALRRRRSGHDVPPTRITPRRVSTNSCASTPREDYGTMCVLLAQTRLTWKVTRHEKDFTFLCSFSNSEGKQEHYLRWRWYKPALKQSSSDFIELSTPKRSLSASSTSSSRQYSRTLQHNLDNDAWLCYHATLEVELGLCARLKGHSLVLLTHDNDATIVPWLRTCILMSALWTVSNAMQDMRRTIENSSPSDKTDTCKLNTSPKRVSFMSLAGSSIASPKRSSIAESPTQAPSTEMPDKTADGHTESPTLRTILQFLKSCLPRKMIRKS